MAAIVGAYESGALGRAVTLAELLDGSVAGEQRDIDLALGLTLTRPPGADAPALSQSRRRRGLAKRSIPAEVTNRAMKMNTIIRIGGTHHQYRPRPIAL